MRFLSLRSVILSSLVVFGALHLGCAKRLDDVEDRMEVIQKRMSALETKGGMPLASDKELLDNQRLADVRSQVAAMRNEITVLSGKVEALEYDHKNVVSRVEDAFKDLDSQKAANKNALSIQRQAASAPQGDDPEGEYNTALRAHQDGDFDRAMKLFEGFVAKNPKHSYADNALFWMGDGYYSQKQYKKAITKFQDLIEKYPKSDKRCDALGKQIAALKELKMNKEAAAFTQVRNAECPSSKSK